MSLEPPDQEKLLEALRGLSLQEKHHLAVFSKLVMEERDLYFRETGRLLRKLPLSKVREQMEQEGLEVALSVLDRVLSSLHPDTPTSNGVADIPTLSPRIKTNKHGDYIDYLTFVPLADILAGLSETLDASQIWDEKTPICISGVRGLYRMDVPALVYQIRGNRFRLVWTIAQGQQPEDSGDSVRRANISRDVGDINKISMKRMELRHPIIHRSATSGYFPGEMFYKFIFDP